jgi:hypothetical protein
MGQVDVVKLEEKPGVDKTVSIKVGLSKTFHDRRRNWWPCWKRSTCRSTC